MSSILKALRKLEEERAIRREGNLDIARDILRRPMSRRRRSLHPALLAAFALVFAVAGGGGYVLLTRQPPAGSPEAGVPSPPPPAAAAPSAPPAQTASRLAAIPAEPVVEEVVRSPEIPPLPRRRLAPVDPLPPPRAEVDSPPRPASPPLPSTAAASAPEAVEPAIAAPDPDGISLTGIVFQDDPDARLAIVNELPVMRGTVIDGATVEEILSDRVRFSRQGKSFEVRLEQ